MTTKKTTGFTAEERAAMRERAKELKAAGSKAEEEAAVVAKIAEMPQPDRGLGERVHAAVKAAAPDLAPRLWYGMPAYAKEGKVVCWFKPASKFKARFATVGFSDQANLDDGRMWPTEYALTEMGRAEESRLRALFKQAAS